MASGVVQLAVSLMTGLVFGYAVEKSRVFEPRSIRNQFIYSRFIMMKMFLSALTTSIVCFCFLSTIPMTRKYFTRIRNGYMSCLTRKGVLMSVCGGVMLGAGMALAATCPGIVLAQIGTLVPNSSYCLAGCFFGVFLYALTDSSLTKYFETSPSKEQTKPIDVYLGIPYPVLGVTMAILTSSVVFVIELLFPWQTEIEGLNLGNEGSLMSQRAWPPYLAGTLIGALQVPVSLLVGDTLGGSQSYCTLLSQMLVIKKLQRKLPYLMQYRHGVENWWQVLFVSGAVGGAYFSAVSSSSLGLAVGIAPSSAFLGGTLMLYGARMAGGCTSGHGLSGFGLMMALSMVAVPAMFGGGTAMGFLIHYLGNESLL
ncbi:UPF0394 inner membrane protein YeeE-like [Asterias rubens]|uniref:UPF0394 inner membrane protein YeeE-like n=1 Tax=Asterias rubens TaxID=7604 RepID=UPI001455426A|nr:UPF0394 inner membrane protein YeeE-like [Asterias rubens]